MRGYAANIQLTVVRGFFKSLQEAIPQSWFPVTSQGEQSAHDGNQRLRWILTTSMRNRQTRPMQRSDTGNLLFCVLNMVCVGSLLYLKNSIHAFDRYNPLTIVVKNKGRILAVEYHHIDLLAEITQTIDDMGLVRLVSLRKIFLQ